MATTRKPAPAKEPTVTVRVIPGLVVYHNGEQRGGTLTGVPEPLARDWSARGWAEIK